MLSEFWTEDEVDVGFAPSGVKRDLVVVLESKTGYREASAARIDRARREVCSDGSGLTHPIPSEQGASRPVVGPKKIGPHDAAAMLTCAVKTSGAAWLWELEKARPPAMPLNKLCQVCRLLCASYKRVLEKILGSWPFPGVSL